MKQPEMHRAASWHPAHVLATWFGAGLFPKAPGTAGSLAALPFAYVISHYLGIIGLGVAIAIVVAVGFWAAHLFSKRTASEDAGPVVIDEVSGLWLTLLLVPADILFYAIGFVLFRIADIIKPWPISWVDRRVKGGLGVMLDDILAGGLAAIVLWNIWLLTKT